MTTVRREAESGDALARAELLASELDFDAAIDTLNAANRVHRDLAIERELVRLRHLAFLHHEAAGQELQPAGAELLTGAERGPLEVAPEQLSAEALRSGIRRHGSVYVPGLIAGDDVRALVDGIDRAFEGLAAHRAGNGELPAESWYEPFRPGRPEYKLGIKRPWVIENGGIWLADSPPMLFRVLEIYRAAGMIDTITAFLGERPALSVNKSTLKRISGSTGGEWHQDGAFLGTGIRTVNVWLSLSHCGDDAPGLAFVPRRIDHIVETGTPGAAFEWAVAPDLVERVAVDPVVRPVFDPGDALMFDELFLHRTAADASMPRERHAIEMWFFAPSAYPDGLAPLLV